MKRLIITALMLVSAFYGYAQNDYGIGDTIRLPQTKFENLEAAAKAPVEKVQIIDLSLQKLSSLPDEVFDYPYLEELYLAYNYWRTLPEEIGTLKNLKVLDISGNYYMKRLPASLGELDNLDLLIIKDHKLLPGEVEKIRRQLPNTRIEDYPFQGL